MILNKIDEKSPNSITSGLDFFHYPTTNVSLSKSHYKEFLTLNPITDPPYHFKLPPTSSFLDFKHMYIKTTWRLTYFDSANQRTVNVSNTNPVSVIQGLGANFIKHMKVSIGGKEVFNANNLYAYKNYLDTELNYSEEAKRTHLAVTGYYPDGDDQNAAPATPPATNSARKRMELFLNGNHAEFIAKLDADIFNIDKYFLNNTEIEIEIHPHEGNWMVLWPGAAANANDSATLNLITCKLYVLYHDVIDGLALSIANRLARPGETAKYAIRGSELKTVYIEAGRNFLDVNLFNGKIPRKLIIGMLARTDYDGTVSTSPFNFQNFDLRTIKVQWNGMENPNIAYQLSYDTNLYTRAYFDMMQACGFAFSPNSNGITMQKFKSGWNIYVFNLTANLEDDKSCELIRYGTTSLHATFGTDIPAGGVTMIVYAETDQLMKIDNNRLITTDLNV